MRTTCSLMAIQIVTFSSFFSNILLAPASPDFEEFLQFIGERITLKGWDKFRGGLDVKSKEFFTSLFIFSP